MAKFKAIFVLVCFLLFSGLIITKLFYLQVKNGEYYQALALGQQIVFEQAQKERGAILTKDNRILAQTREKSVVYLIPEKMTDKTEVVNQLTPILADLALAEEAQEPLKIDISQEQFDEIKALNLPGVIVDTLLERVYPFGDLASAVLGFVNQDGLGQYGLEGYYNDLIEGESFVKGKALSPDFLQLFLKDNLAREEEKSDLVLNLDYNIQYFAEKLLKEAKEEWHFDKAQIIVEDPKTGKILALALNPSFDPNKFSQVADQTVFTNSAVQELFEPGSVFKPITMAAGLEEGLVTPETTYEDTGKVELGGPPIYNFDKRIWGEQTMTDVLEESINTGAVFVEQKLGKDTFLKYVKNFGFFEPTNIDLAGEVYSSNQTLRNGYPRDFASASFGQGIMLTSMQLVRAFSAIANNGFLLEPKMSADFEPKEGKQVISQATAAKLTAMLVSVIKSGAGRKAAVPGYYLAGKTGTAQVPLKTGGYDTEKTIQSFIGYFPALDPQFVVFVRMDNPKQANAASSSAAPIFGKLAKYILDLYQIPPDY